METKNYDPQAFFYTDQVVKMDNTLTDISKLIFSDIAYFFFLRTGICTAANTYFAKKFSKSNGTISKAISALADRGYIERYVDEYKMRKIYVKRSKFAKNLNTEGCSINENATPDIKNNFTNLSTKEMEEIITKSLSNV